jgi:hypothetical protein
MKVTVSSLDEVPESLQSEYEEKDGKFYLKLEGEPSGYAKASDLAEFRDNNIALQKRIKKLSAEFEGIDPAEHKKLKGRIAELEKQGIKGDGDSLQKIIEKAVTPLQKKLEEMSEREKRANEALEKRDLESLLSKEGLKAGISEKAMPDYLRRGLEVFKLDDGKAVARDGDTPLFSKVKPSEPLSISEWVGGLSSDAPHLFKASAGGGSKPAGGDGGAVTYDPADQDAFLANVDKIAKGEVKPRQSN